jgi:hypothetical protein
VGGDEEKFCFYFYMCRCCYVEHDNDVNRAIV